VVFKKPVLGGHLNFFNKHQFQVVDKFWQEGSGFGYLKKSEPNNDGFGYVKKNQIERTSGFGYFKNPKALPGFMKEPEKKWWFVGNYLTLSKNEKGGIFHSKVLDFWRPAKKNRPFRGPNNKTWLVWKFSKIQYQ
jgi:hypothetical protein